jgi:hypothetical protein
MSCATFVTQQIKISKQMFQSGKQGLGFGLLIFFIQMLLLFGLVWVV